MKQVRHILYLKFKIVFISISKTNLRSRLPKYKFYLLHFFGLKLFLCEFVNVNFLSISKTNLRRRLPKYIYLLQFLLLILLFSCLARNSRGLPYSYHTWVRVSLVTEDNGSWTGKGLYGPQGHLHLPQEIDVPSVSSIGGHTTLL